MTSRVDARCGLRFGDPAPDARDDIRRARDIVARRVPAETQAQRAARLIMREPHREQHMRRLDRAGRARGTHRDVNPFEVERDQHALAEHAREREVQRIRQAVANRRVEAQARDRIEEIREKFVGERRYAQRLVMKMLARPPPRRRRMRSRREDSACPREVRSPADRRGESASAPTGRGRRARRFRPARQACVH